MFYVKIILVCLNQVHIDPGRLGSDELEICIAVAHRLYFFILSR